MVRNSATSRKPYRRPYDADLGRAGGSQSQREDTQVGATYPLSIQIPLVAWVRLPGEVVEDAATHDDTATALGSVLNHVLLHQAVRLVREAVISLRWQERTQISSLAARVAAATSVVLPSLYAIVSAGRVIRIIAAELAACPSLARYLCLTILAITGMPGRWMPMHTWATTVPAGIYGRVCAISWHEPADQPSPES